MRSLFALALVGAVALAGRDDPPTTLEFEEFEMPETTSSDQQTREEYWDMSFAEYVDKFDKQYKNKGEYNIHKEAWKKAKRQR